MHSAQTHRAAQLENLARYDISKSYVWNFEHAPNPVDVEVEPLPGNWSFCGHKVNSPLGVSAGPLLNGKWCLYYASLGFDIITYKTVRTGVRDCYEMPNLQPVDAREILERDYLQTVDEMHKDWAVSFGMPSKHPTFWQQDVKQTRASLDNEKILVVSIVGTVHENQSVDELANDYADCARMAVQAGADIIEANFSCPNVSTPDGQLFQNCIDAGKVAKAIKSAIANVPLILKIGRVETEPQTERLIEQVGSFASAIAMTNSVARKVKTKQQHWVFGGQKRGICGRSILEPSLNQISMFARVLANFRFDIELIGVGGIFEADHVKQYIARGATSVAMATSAMLDPAIAIKIRKQW